MHTIASQMPRQPYCNQHKKKKISPRSWRKRRRWSILAFGLGLLWSLSAQSPSASAACQYPGDVLDLSGWKETLPIGSSKKPTEIKSSALSTFVHKTYFRTNTGCDAVLFRAPVSGVTTSGSGYPRSELREMTGGGKDLASWSTTSGTHAMFIDQAITAVPKKKKHIVAGQIHDAKDDVIVVRLEYPKLFVDINGKEGPVLDPNYTLGKRFTVKFVAENGKIGVYYNGGEKPVHTLSKKGSGYYFKAGAYTQSNCSKESVCDENNYGEVAIYRLAAGHGDRAIVETIPSPSSPVVSPPTPASSPLPSPESAPVVEPASQPTPVAVPALVPSLVPETASSIVVEAEAGETSGGMRVISDDATASGGKYVQAESSGSVQYRVNVPSAGKYRIAGWIITADTSSDSFKISVDKKSSTWTLPSPRAGWTFDVHDTKSYTLKAGSHMITLKYREKGANIDRLELIKD